ncbi:MAG: heparinase II/III family protein, partial [Planctomycetota bacterium]
YCSGWIGNFVEMAKPLSLAGIDLYEQPKIRLMFDAQIDMLCTGAFTPAIGDAGSIDSGWIGPDVTTYEAAYRNLRLSRYAWVLDQLGAVKDKNVQSFEDLFTVQILEKARSDAQKYQHKPNSRLMDGYGLAVLNNPNDSVAVSMYYGIKGGHGHFDRLNIELFAYDKRLSPDLGYPDFMNAFVPGIYSWSKNTVSHNCLVIDQTIQQGNASGVVLRFHDSPTVHVVDVDAQGSYSKADVYRRTLVLVDVGENDSYLVDIFRVRGGKDHALSIHGPEGEFSLVGASLSPAVTEGTLAGRAVDYGRLYDNPILGKPGYKGSFSSYKGSGYQHFFNWQRVIPDEPVMGCWKIGGDSAAQLRVHVPPHTGQELIVADAYVSPTRKIPTILKYMLLRRSGDQLGNTLVTVWEPVSSEPMIERVKLHEVASLGRGCNRIVVMSVHRGDTIDMIAIAPEQGQQYPIGSGLTSDAAVVVISEQKGRRIRTFAAGGTKLSTNKSGDSIDIPSTISGTIRAVDYAAKRIDVRIDSGLITPATLLGRMVRIFNADHSCVYKIASARLDNRTLTLELTGSDIFTGRIKVRSVDREAGTITTPTSILYPYHLAGMHLVTEDLKHAVPVVSMDKGVIRLPPDAVLAPFVPPNSESDGRNAWIVDMGVGDRIEIERFVHKSAS